MRLRVWNLTRQCDLASHVEVARTAAARRKGLLGRNALEPAEGLWLVPCASIHTFFMRFAIDLVYLDRQHRVKKVRSAVPPWRLSVCLTAHSVIELPAGSAEQTNTQPGDQLEISSSDSGGAYSTNRRTFSTCARNSATSSRKAATSACKSVPATDGSAGAGDSAGSPDSR